MLNRYDLWALWVFLFCSLLLGLFAMLSQLVR
jgi:hypothetical protein